MSAAEYSVDDPQFVKSSAKRQECPKADRPEYAFIGRSNVGKSSLINMLTGRKALAKTSSTPGKTQLLNHFSMSTAGRESISIMMHIRFSRLVRYSFDVRSHDLRSFLDTLA